MNKEVLPLIGFIAVALIIVLLIVLYFYGFDVTEFFKNIAPIYYIIVFPIVLGFLVAVMKLRGMQ